MGNNETTHLMPDSLFGEFTNASESLISETSGNAPGLYNINVFIIASSAGGRHLAVSRQVMFTRSAHAVRCLFTCEPAIETA